MRVVVTAEARYSRTPDGSVWTVDGPAYGFWTRYLSAFDEVRLVARVQDVDGAGAGASRVDGPQVEVWQVPYYVGLREYLTVRRAAVRSMVDAAGPSDAVILRVPSLIGTLLARQREQRALPYALEVVGDPAAVFAPGVVRHPLRPLLRHWYTSRMQHQCRQASAVSYVTERALQDRYPTRPGTPVSAYSSIYLPSEAYVSHARPARPPASRPALVSVGALSRPYKGIDVLLHAVALLARDGTEVEVTHLGDGPLRPRLQHLAQRLGVSDHVHFPGASPSGLPVRRQLDAADLFVLPSRTEGLPRALIEAMARALPAVASRVGGIPELLEPEDLVPPDDPAALAGRIRSMLNDPTGMAAASARNLTRARDFATDILTPRRDEFYRTFRSSVAEKTRTTTA
ncbi:glycosyltransferase [Micromonospora humi]|uniref:Glycosyltransferase involved in cell wall bisynthesis n=1 Tax=Micromonospora humi TaxID=745366 RepID=A0A1C5K792_9ACTN|nr:glycosyltransferase [Micromonospora humi]SCG78673.1 Glycosyltransferase involved in cell wall bisynthesis [Micromonospora humi]